MVAVSAFLLANPIFKLEYNATVKKTVKGDGSCIRKDYDLAKIDFDNQRHPIRINSDRIGNERADRYISGADNILLYIPKFDETILQVVMEDTEAVVLIVLYIIRCMIRSLIRTAVGTM